MAKKYLVSECAIDMFEDSDPLDIVNSVKQAEEFLDVWGCDIVYVYEIEPKLMGTYQMGPVFTAAKKGK